jgi:hypothetical protein
MAAAAAELRRQEWFDLEDEAIRRLPRRGRPRSPGLRSAASTFGWVADGWI